METDDWTDLCRLGVDHRMMQQNAGQNRLADPKVRPSTDGKTTTIKPRAQLVPTKQHHKGESRANHEAPQKAGYEFGAEYRAEFGAEAERLLAFEFGHARDMAIRLTGVSAVCLWFYLYTQFIFVFVWGVGYAAAYACGFFFLKSLGPKVSHGQILTAHLLLLGLAFGFLLLPGWMLLQDDRHLALVGLALIGVQFAQLVDRGDTYLLQIYGTLALAGGLTIPLSIKVFPGVDNAILIIGLLASWGCLLIALARAMLRARSRRLAAEDARLRAFHAQKLASVGQLAGGVAHDFNNVLTVISGNLDLYQVLKDKSEKDEVVEAALSACRRAAKIVEQILITTHKSKTAFQCVNANKPISSLKLLTDHLVPANVQLTVSPLSNPPFVKIDETQFVIALLNIVINAVDALPNGGSISISVKADLRQKEVLFTGGKRSGRGPHVIYEVGDSGGGIPADILTSIMEPFFTTKPVGKGTGLGLAMAASVAESAGGGIVIETSSCGTKVRIFTPIKSENE